jgi:hypothetical protein
MKSNSAKAPSHKQKGIVKNMNQSAPQIMNHITKTSETSIV